MKEAVRYYCGICNAEFNTPEEAQKCESVGVEELRVRVGDYCYLVEEFEGFFGRRIRCRRARVVAILGPTNFHSYIARYNKTVPAPHMYEILVTTKKLDRPRSVNKEKLPRYSQCKIYVPAAEK